MWLFKNVGKSKLSIINYSGGTESRRNSHGNFLLPLKPCHSPPLPGMAADVVDEDGKSISQTKLAAGHPQAVDRHDARFWKDPQRLHRDVFEPLARRVDHGDFPPGLMTTACGTSWAAATKNNDSRGKRLGPTKLKSILVADARRGKSRPRSASRRMKGQALRSASASSNPNDAEMILDPASSRGS